MSITNLAISIITFKRSELLDLCLKSVESALKDYQFPIYIILQDPSPDDEKILEKHEALLTKIERIHNDQRDVEDLINRNRIRAWEIALIENSHDFVVCLEDDVEISSDFFDFTLAILEQNSTDSDFFGINYGSFETTSTYGSYSKLRYGLHGPASLITKKAYHRFRIRLLKAFHGKIAWDSWVEPITKTGFMATSNAARYLDNGINGTHASASIDNLYFTKLRKSFKSGADVNPNYLHVQISHSWRSDCVPYLKNANFVYEVKGMCMTWFQVMRVFIRKLKESV